MEENVIIMITVPFSPKPIKGSYGVIPDFFGSFSATFPTLSEALKAVEFSEITTLSFEDFHISSKQRRALFYALSVAFCSSGSHSFSVPKRAIPAISRLIVETWGLVTPIHKPPTPLFPGVSGEYLKSRIKDFVADSKSFTKEDIIKHIQEMYPSACLTFLKEYKDDKAFLYELVEVALVEKPLYKESPQILNEVYCENNLKALKELLEKEAIKKIIDMGLKSVK
jgi:hypothetical protein